MCWPRAIQSQFLLIPPGISVLSLSYRMKTRDSEPCPHRLSISALTQIRCRSPTPSSARQRGSCRRSRPLLRRGLRGLGSLLCVGSACSEPRSLPSLSLRVPVPPGCPVPSCLNWLGLPGPEPHELMLFPSRRCFSPTPGPQVAWVWLGSLFAFVSPSGGSEGTATQLCAARTSPVGQLSPAAQGTAQACPEVSLAPFPEASVGPPPAPSPVLTYSPTPTGQTGDTCGSPLGFWRAEVTFPPRLRLCLSPPLPQSTERLFAVSLVSPSPASHSPAFSPSVSSPVSKQRKNVISCVTVHDSPYSDSSSITSPYAVQHRSGHSAATFDTKGNLESHCTGNPRTIIVPPLKTQASEALVECDSLGPGNLGPGRPGASLRRLVFWFPAVRHLVTGELLSPGW